MFHAGGQDDRPGFPGLSFGGYNHLVIPVILNLHNLYQVHLRSLLQDLIQKGLGKFVSAHSQGAGPVFHLRAVRNLPAEAVLFQYQHRLPIPQGIERRRHARRTAAHHNQIIHFPLPPQSAKRRRRSASPVLHSSEWFLPAGRFPGSDYLFLSLNTL